ncbi:hypothetical protein [uncultured Tateyamaria sp.]|uniref:hypothetical protein n=1 Tax=Tateyamaria sp. 1078 TaxID=3417464 RepID=UPI0026279DA0|nr:hypothetical protein [uncultured Tateyamaria sp.]
MSLQTDWTDFLAQPAAFEDDHFSHLLYENGALDNVETLFSSLPEGRAIARNVRQLVTEWELGRAYYVSRGYAPLEQQIARARAYVASLVKFATEEGEMDEADRLRNAPLVTVDDRDTFEAMFRDRKVQRSEVPDLLNDVVLDLLASADSRLFALQEAIMELTRSFEVTHWVLNPVLGLQIDLDAAYAFQRDGGYILLAENQTIIFSPQTEFVEASNQS